MKGFPQLFGKIFAFTPCNLTASYQLKVRGSRRFGVSPDEGVAGYGCRHVRCNSGSSVERHRRVTCRQGAGITLRCVVLEETGEEVEPIETLHT